jgi:hypothetical protein
MIREILGMLMRCMLCIWVLAACNASEGSDVKSAGPAERSGSPVSCNYAPPGEYVKDHTLVFHDGWWHLYSISGTAGYYHGYTGNEETFSWSISKDLVNWEFRGHVLHASNREGAFDQHEVWAPFVLKTPQKFYMFYSGIVHPYRPMEYRKLGHNHPGVFEGHKESQGLACSDDLTDWVKISDFSMGLDVRGRDSHVIRDKQNKRWLLYSTIGAKKANVSQSQDLIHWKSLGICAEFTDLDPGLDFGPTVRGIWGHNTRNFNNAESLNIMKHPVSNKWIMLANWQYILSDDPTDFKNSKVRIYDTQYKGKRVDIGFAGETVKHNGKWYRSGTFGTRDYWKLGFTEIEWLRDGAFKIVKPSTVARIKNGTSESE